MIRLQEMGEETAKQIIASSKVITEGPRQRMVADVASYVKLQLTSFRLL